MIAHRIDSAGTTIVVAGPEGRIPGIVYWGASLPAGEDLVALGQAFAYPVAHAGLDEPYRPSLFPEGGHGWPGTPALEAFSRAHGGTSRWLTAFRPTSIEAAGGSLRIDAEDAPAALGLVLSLSLDADTGVLRAFTRLENRGAQSLVVTWLAAPALPVPRTDAAMLTWHGRWCAEFQRDERAWARGAHILESRVGRTSHETFPGLVSLSAGAGETAGRVTGVHLAWSGNWRIVAEDHAPGDRRILAGVLPLPGELVLAPGEAAETPTVFAAVSETGLGGLSAAFHGEVRTRIIRHPRPGAPRPVHFNSWEAVYFDLDMDRLKDLATAAAAVGAERFVLDDGWFPGRTSDRAGLGDWEVDRTRFPDGLHPLVDHVHGLGLSFGLWVEPEMVNPDSELFRRHPDWVLAVEGHGLPTGRHQLVLDLARPEVFDHILVRLDAIFAEYPITYVKWDMNRVLAAPGRDGRPVAAAQATALYALLDRLRERHPGIEFESCSSGGGRIDYGVLAHTTRFWLSDNNDTHDRWRMNREASVFFPPEVFGHHVGPAPAHTSGRVLSMAFRAFSAAVGGHMGLELDLAALSAEERATLSAAIAFHKRWRDVLHGGRFHRLEMEAPWLGQMTVAPGGGRFLAAATLTETSGRAAGPLMPFTGLEPNALYRVRFAEGVPFHPVGDRRYTSPLTGPDGMTASGRALMAGVLRLPVGWPDGLVIVEGARLGTGDAA